VSLPSNGDSERQIELVLGRDGDGSVLRREKSLLNEIRAKSELEVKWYKTYVTCSAALPTTGSRIKATNSVEILPVAVRPLIDETRNSAVTPCELVTNSRVSYSEKTEERENRRGLTVRTVTTTSKPRAK
jgi:hypothetical protein